MTIRNLEALLAPQSVVLIGATQKPGSVGATIARNLLATPFPGEVHYVNPRYDQLLGKRCHADVAALPGTPDLAIIATPTRTVVDVTRAVAARGTRAIVAITAGLDEAAKTAMLEAGRSRLVRVLGPNSIGLNLPWAGLNASFAHRPALRGDLAFLSQSGALVTAVVDWASSRGIGFSHVVSLGDMADVDFGDLLDYLAGDTRSRAILLYVEALTHAPKFMSAARRAARAKPVIAIKAGRHASAARAAASHTGRLAGNDAAYDAAFRRAGVLRVTALEDLFEAAEMLARAPPLGGERLMIVTNGGGAGVLATDHLADEEGVLAELSAASRAALDVVLPAAWSKANPVDVIGDAGPDRYAAAVEAVFADPAADAVLAINCPTALASSTDIATRVISTYRSPVNGPARKPLITCWLGEEAATGARKAFADAGIPTFDTPGSAVGGFMHLVRYARAQTELMRTPPLMPQGHAPDVAAAQAVIDQALAAGRNTLSEVEGKALLDAYGIPVVPTRAAAGPAEAARVASSMLAEHTAVVLKILSEDITHKSDVGGVHLDLTSADAVEEAARAMLARVHEVRPQARVAGFTVSPMIRRPRAHELILGMSVDATFGPLVLFGAGGTSVEVVADTAVALPPLDLRLAEEQIGRTRIARLLRGYRDRKPADCAAIAQALVRLSALVCQHPEIRELDINPLLADEAGVIALDARVRLGDEQREPRVSLAVKPYPRGWEKVINVPALGEILLRPIRPEDEALYETFFARLTPADIRMRLFAPKKRVSHKFVARLTQIDYAREIAFVAIPATSGELLGVSRFVADPDRVQAEYAVLVRSDLKGMGLGWQLMQQLIDYAVATGVGEITGSVLAENTGMLRMCRDLGFTVTTDPEDASLKHVRLPLRSRASDAAP